MTDLPNVPSTGMIEAGAVALKDAFGKPLGEMAQEAYTKMEAQRISEIPLPREPYALGSTPDLSKYKTVFEDEFSEFKPYHPVNNPTGRWATVGNTALDGTLRRRDADGKRYGPALTLDEIDADPVLRVEHRTPKWGGEFSIFTDSTLGPDFDVFKVVDGKLVMSGFEIPLHLRDQVGGRAYAASRIWLTSGGKPTPFKYGWFNARMKFDVYEGAHPAFWLLNMPELGPWTSEIDIVEYLGHWSQAWETYQKKLTAAKAAGTKLPKIPGNLDMTHWAWHLDMNAKKLGGDHEGESINRTWHDFGCLWEPDLISYYLDGKCIASMVNPGLHDTMYPILNLAIASPMAMLPYRQGGELPRPEDFPMTVEVERVTIAQK